MSDELASLSRAYKSDVIDKLLELDWEDFDPIGFLNEFLDVGVLINSQKEVKMIRLLRTFGGPNVWWEIWPDVIEVEVCLAFYKCSRVIVYHEKISKLFALLAEFIEATWF